MSRSMWCAKMKSWKRSGTSLKQVKAEMGQQLPNIHYQKFLHSIERNVAGKDDWVLFEQNFDEVHEQFFKRLRTNIPFDLSLGAPAGGLSSDESFHQRNGSGSGYFHTRCGN
jgi:predicted alpha/beta-fold hydrolase